MQASGQSLEVAKVASQSGFAGFFCASEVRCAPHWRSTVAAAVNRYTARHFAGPAWPLPNCRSVSCATIPTTNWM
jgi:hypothetical protein